MRFWARWSAARYAASRDDGADAVGYGIDYPIFWIDRFHRTEQSNHTAFSARNRAEVDALHAAL